MTWMSWYLGQQYKLHRNRLCSSVDSCFTLACTVCFTRRPICQYHASLRPGPMTSARPKRPSGFSPSSATQERDWTDRQVCMLHCKKSSCDGGVDHKQFWGVVSIVKWCKIVIYVTINKHRNGKTKEKNRNALYHILPASTNLTRHEPQRAMEFHGLDKTRSNSQENPRPRSGWIKEVKLSAWNLFPKYFISLKFKDRLLHVSFKIKSSQVHSLKISSMNR